MQILVLNVGSSSLKFEVIASGEWKRLLRGSVEHFGENAAVTVSPEEDGRKQTNTSIPDGNAAVEYVLKTEVRATEIDAVGHRVVHGGERFHDAVVINDEVLRSIEECAELAPLHNASSVQAIKVSRAMFGNRVPQVAVFDTAFHQTLPEHAFLYAIPYELYETYGIRRYGFHGTSYRYILDRFLETTKSDLESSKVIILHLGNGCSICAIQNGKSVDTSMGLTPLEGLVMGTRSGDIDASVVDFLARKQGQTTEQIENMLNKRSGLLGISGSTSDMRELIHVQKDDKRAELAIRLFCYRARKYIGSYLAALGGADAIVFTGGIGEHNADVRKRICEGLDWFGIKLDESRNAAAGEQQVISSEDSRVAVYVIPTDEELMIAKDTARLVG